MKALTLSRIENLKANLIGKRAKVNYPNMPESGAIVELGESYGIHYVYVKIHKTGEVATFYMKPDGFGSADMILI